METCCGCRYDRARERSRLPSLGFSRAVGSAPDATSSVALCRTSGPYLRTIRFQGNAPSRRKDNSSRGSRRRLRVRLRCRCRPRPPPRSGSRMLTRFPFGARHRATPSGGPAGAGCPVGRLGGIAPSLRIDSPVSNCCSHGTLPHFSLQGPPLNICYYHQDLHRGPLHRRSRRRLHRTGLRRAVRRVGDGDPRALLLPAAYRVACGRRETWRDASAPSIFRAS